MGAVADRHAVGDEIVLEARHAADEGVRADACELDARPAPPPKITKSPTVTWPASMTLFDRMTLLPTCASWPTCELARKAQRSPTTVFRPPPGGAGIHRDAFADDAIGADRQRRGLAGIFQVLRRMADRGEGIDPRARADRRAAGDDDMALQFAAVAEYRPPGRRCRTVRCGRPRRASRRPRRSRSGGSDAGAHSATSMARDLGLADERAVDLRLALVPPHVAAVVELASCDTRPCRRARRACGTCTCRSS